MKKLLAVIGFAMMTSFAMAADYQEGTQYNAITPPPPEGSGNEIVVEEFFMYTCPHCKDLEPAMNSWLEKKPEGVVFTPRAGHVWRRGDPACQGLLRAGDYW